MEWLARHFEVANLTGLLRRNGARPRIAVTFDDGYVDNLHHALPVLERCGVPATIFVTSGYINRDREFWWDELEHTMLLGTEMPANLRLQSSIGIWETAGERLADRLEIYHSLHRWLLPQPPAAQDSALAQLRQEFGAASVVRPSHRPLRTQELVRLAQSPLITIGGHTVNHVALGSRPRQEQQREVAQGLADLQQMTGHAVTSFSYPYGTRVAIGSHAPRIVAEAGCVAARANWPGLVTRRSNPFLLPGFIVRDWSAEELESRLVAYLSGASHYNDY
jgi:peptidoglycan/xylan/chitin deacetylase (PgdA/CDA1 family)